MFNFLLKLNKIVSLKYSQAPLGFIMQNNAKGNEPKEYSYMVMFS